MSNFELKGGIHTRRSTKDLPIGKRIAHKQKLSAAHPRAKKVKITLATIQTLLSENEIAALCGSEKAQKRIKDGR